jgi:hypothetical protein
MLASPSDVRVLTKHSAAALSGCYSIAVFLVQLPLVRNLSG